MPSLLVPASAAGRPLYKTHRTERAISQNQKRRAIHPSPPDVLHVVVGDGEAPHVPGLLRGAPRPLRLRRRAGEHRRRRAVVEAGGRGTGCRGARPRRLVTRREEAGAVVAGRVRAGVRRAQLLRDRRHAGTIVEPLLIGSSICDLFCTSL